MDIDNNKHKTEFYLNLLGTFCDISLFMCLYKYAHETGHTLKS